MNVYVLASLTETDGYAYVLGAYSNMEKAKKARKWWSHHYHPALGEIVKEDIDIHCVTLDLELLD